MGGEHLGHLVELGEGALQVLGGGQMAGLALALGQRLVGDVADEVLQEAVLAALRGAGVRLQGQDFLAYQDGEKRFEFGFGQPAQSSERTQRERLAEHRPVLQQPSLLSSKPVQARGDQRMQGLWHLEGLDLTRGPIDRAVLGEQAAIQEHPHRLHRIQRHPLRSPQDLCAQPLRQARNEALQQLLHRSLRERLQVQACEVPLPRTPTRAALLQLRPGQSNHVQREVARPLQQVLHEIEEARVRPLHVLEGEHRRVHVSQPLKEQPPGRKQILPVTHRSLLQTKQVRQPRLHKRPLLRIQQMLHQRHLELLACRRGLLVLGDPTAHPHHVRQRPVGNTFAVGETASAVPPDLLHDPVEVLVELPRQPRLADPRDPGHRHQMRLALSRRGVEEILDLA